MLLIAHPRTNFRGRAFLQGGTPGDVATGSLPVISSASLVVFSKHSANQFTVKVAGSQPLTLFIQGALPQGVTFKNGVFAGTPKGPPVAYSLLVTAANVYGSQTQVFTLSVRN